MTGVQTCALPISHLEGHFAAEEDVLFPAVAAHLAPDAAEHALLAALVADHRAMEAECDAIARALDARRQRGADTDAGGDRDHDAPLAAPLRALADTLERHVRREERELFARFPALAGDGDHAAVEQGITAILARRPPAACALGPAS